MSDTTPDAKALLLFQLGPVQEFITRARSTRDLWSGSFLVSWMAAQTVRWLRDEFGEKNVEFVFPFVPRAHDDAANFPPTLRWIETQRENRNPLDAPDALMPAIPNRLLAVVPASCDKAKIADLIAGVFSSNKGSVWGKIAEACWTFLTEEGQGAPCDKALWDRQIEVHWQTSWQLWPMDRLEEARKLMEQTVLGREALEEFSPLNPWMENYHAVSYLLDARRQTRDFAGWQGEARRPKDAFSGKEEALVFHDPDETAPCWLREARHKSAKLRHLFRGNDSLGAVSLIKRVWHRPYLHDTQGFDKPGPKSDSAIDKSGPKGDTWFNVPSVPGIAAYPWAVEARKSDLGDTDVMQRLQRAVAKIDRHVDTRLAQPEDGESSRAWMKRVDWQVFHENFWKAEKRAAEQESDGDHLAAAEEGLQALNQVIKAAKDLHLGTPCSYYAVIAMDGDSMGKWLSGQKLGRSLDRQTHENISRGLTLATIGQCSKFADLAAYSPGARKVFEDAMERGASQEHPFQGKVLYAGADDVLAIVPATQAIDCASAMAQVFREVMEKTVAAGSQAAKFSISAGIAIGHIKEPLQDLVETAFAELRRAKDTMNGNAVAVTLYKRSGEMTLWGSGFGPSGTPAPAFQLLTFYQKHSRQRAGEGTYKPPVSGRFPHRLTEILSRYPTGNGRTALSKDLAEIAKGEFTFVASKQVADDHEAVGKELVRLANAYLDEMQAWTPDPANPKLRAPNISHLCNLFQIEAFIARQEE